MVEGGVGGQEKCVRRTMVYSLRFSLAREIGQGASTALPCPVHLQLSLRDLGCPGGCGFRAGDVHSCPPVHCVHLAFMSIVSIRSLIPSCLCPWCPSMFIHVHLCSSMSISVHPCPCCLPMPTCVHPCPPIHLCSPMSTYVHSCPSMSTLSTLSIYVCPCPFMLTYVHLYTHVPLYTPMFIHVYPCHLCPPMFVSILLCPSVSLCPSMFPCPLVTHVHSCLPALTHVPPCPSLSFRFHLSTHLLSCPSTSLQSLSQLNPFLDYRQTRKLSQEGGAGWSRCMLHDQVPCSASHMAPLFTPGTPGVIPEYRLCASP